MSNMLGIMSQMPPLPVFLDEELASSLLPNSTQVISPSDKILWDQLYLFITEFPFSNISKTSYNSKQWLKFCLLDTLLKVEHSKYIFDTDIL